MIQRWSIEKLIFFNIDNASGSHMQRQKTKSKMAKIFDASISISLC